MITKKEIITITRDDPLAEKCDEVFTKENGWTKEESTVSVTYTCEQWFAGVMVKEEMKK
jgi:hypothetical protein